MDFDLPKDLVDYLAVLDQFIEDKIAAAGAGRQ